MSERVLQSEVRAWGNIHGRTANRGALPKALIDAWNKAHPDRQYVPPKRPKSLYVTYEKMIEAGQRGRYNRWHK